MENLKFIVTEATEPAKCFYCHRVRELRPYGPQGQGICFDCGMHNRAETEKQFAKRFEA